MTPPFVDPFSRSYHDYSVNDLIVFTNHAADKAETHVAFQGAVSDYVTMPPQLREMANELGVARDAAAGHDDNRVAEQNALMETTIRALDHNSYHIALLAVHRKDPDILLNSAFETKPPKTSKGKINLLDLVPGLSAKHLKGVEGAIYLAFKREKPNAVFELQMTETPDDEASWRRVDEGTYNRSRVELRGLQPTRRLYFRVRYHEGGAVGAWSQPVSIIVL